jgi:hypothetical protein
MAHIDNSKWAVLRELALDRFPEDADAMHRAEELAVQQPGDPAAFVGTTEALVQVDEEKRVGEALVVINQRARNVVGSRQAEQEVWALAAVVAAYQQKEVVEVSKDAARQATALLQSQSVDIATVESTAGPTLGPYRTAVDLIASADHTAMAEAYVVGMVVPQEQHVEEVGASDDIEALFSDSDDGEVVASVMTDEQVALMASFETAHREESTRQFMAAEREALSAMLVVHANAAREAVRVAAEEEVARVAARAVEVALDLAAREEAAAVEVAHETARAVAREEQAEEAAAEVAAQKEMAWDRCRWDENMAAARCLREVHELAT